MASRILTQFKQKITSLELQPAGGGAFEVTLDGELAYSKLESGEFPQEDAILNMIGGRVGG